MCIKTVTETKCRDCDKATISAELKVMCPKLKKVKADCTEEDIGLCGFLKSGTTTTFEKCGDCKDKANKAATSKR